MASRPSEPVALVTGAAAPNGIGAACARALAGEGCAVGLLDREACDAVAEEIVAGGGRAMAVRADLRSEEETLAAVDELETAGGGLSRLRRRGLRHRCQHRRRWWRQRDVRMTPVARASAARPHIC